MAQVADRAWGRLFPPGGAPVKRSTAASGRAAWPSTQHLGDRRRQHVRHQVDLGFADDERRPEADDVARGAGAARIEEHAVLETVADDARRDPLGWLELLQRLAVADQLDGLQEAAPTHLGHVRVLAEAVIERIGEARPQGL